MIQLPDRVSATTATTGTGSIALGAALSGYRTPPTSYSGTVGVPYFITDGTAWETGEATITYAASVWTCTRALRESSTGSLLSLSGTAVWTIDVGGLDLITLPLFVDVNVATYTFILGQTCRLRTRVTAGTLPASPGLGGRPIAIVDGTGSAATLPHTINRSGSDLIYVAGVSDTSASIDVADVVVTFIPIAGGWEVKV
jgi:hypothetical protein